MLSVKLMNVKDKNRFPKKYDKNAFLGLLMNTAALKNCLTDTFITKINSTSFILSMLFSSLFLIIFCLHVFNNLTYHQRIALNYGLSMPIMAIGAPFLVHIDALPYCGDPIHFETPKNAPAPLLEITLLYMFIILWSLPMRLHHFSFFTIANIILSFYLYKPFELILSLLK